MQAAPTSAPTSPPRPPPTGVPPSDTAAIAIKVYWSPSDESAERIKPVSASPAIAANIPPSAYATTRIAPTFIPDANAVGASPPTENIALTNGVRLSASHTSSGTTIVTRPPGTGPNFPPRWLVQLD